MFKKINAIQVTFLLSFADALIAPHLGSVINGNFQRCRKNENGKDICVLEDIKQVFEYKTECTIAKNERFVIFRHNDEMGYGVLDQDKNIITDSECSYEELHTIFEKLNKVKNFGGIKFKNFYDDAADAVLISIIGFLITLISFLKYGCCKKIEECIEIDFECLKKNKKTDPHKQYVIQDYYVPPIEIQKLASHNFLNIQPTQSNDAHHRYASAPELFNHPDEIEVSRSVKRSHRETSQSVSNLPDIDQTMINRPMLTASRRSFLRSSTLSSTVNEMPPISEASEVRMNCTINNRGCGCTKGDCKLKPYNCSCNSRRINCTATCHPSRICNNYNTY